jgi:hypothetical protein
LTTWAGETEESCSCQRPILYETAVRATETARHTASVQRHAIRPSKSIDQYKEMGVMLCYHEVSGTEEPLNGWPLFVLPIQIISINQTSPSTADDRLFSERVGRQCIDIIRYKSCPLQNRRAPPCLRAPYRTRKWRFCMSAPISVDARGCC